jgi:hypothetical protein
MLPEIGDPRASHSSVRLGIQGRLGVRKVPLQDGPHRLLTMRLSAHATILPTKVPFSFPSSREALVVDRRGFGDGHVVGSRIDPVATSSSRSWTRSVSLKWSSRVVTRPMVVRGLMRPPAS